MERAHQDLCLPLSRLRIRQATSLSHSVQQQMRRSFAYRMCVESWTDLQATFRIMREKLDCSEHLSAVLSRASASLGTTADNMKTASQPEKRESLNFSDV